MFAIVRLLIILLIFGIVYYFGYRKYHIIKRFSLLLLTLFVSAVIYLVPFENLMVTFSSVDSAYNYIGVGELCVSVDGEISTFALSSKDNSNTLSVHVFSKVDEGWKLCNGLNLKLLYASSDSYSIKVYRYKSSSDYYIVLSEKNDSQMAISDIYNTCFVGFPVNGSHGHYAYCAYIKDFCFPYTVNIDGKEVLFDQ